MLRLINEMIWFKHKTPVENVNETFQKRLKDVETRLIGAESEILALNLEIKLMRDKVLRKIQSKREPETEENEPNWNGIPLN